MRGNKSGNWFVRHKILTIVLALIVVVIAASAASGSGDNTKNNIQPATTNNAAAKNNTGSKSSAAKIGTPVRDGRFEFTVKSVNCGKSEIVSPDSDALRKTAQGQFCTVAMTVKNIGNEQQGFFSSNQKILDSSNKQYSSDDVATAYATPTSQQNNWSQINPGNSIDATIVFDLPKGVTATTAELHDSAFSSGAKVSLQK